MRKYTLEKNLEIFNTYFSDNKLFKQVGYYDSIHKCIIHSRILNIRIMENKLFQENISNIQQDLN